MKSLKDTRVRVIKLSLTLNVWKSWQSNCSRDSNSGFHSVVAKCFETPDLFLSEIQAKQSISFVKTFLQHSRFSFTSDIIIGEED